MCVLCEGEHKPCSTLSILVHMYLSEKSDLKSEGDASNDYDNH